MKYYFFIQNNRICGVGQARLIGDEYLNVETEQELADAYILDMDSVIWDGEQVVYNPKYAEMKAKQREEEFDKNFFKTSIGYVKRYVTMKSGAQKDFLTDLLSLMVPGTPILVYDKPDFTKEVTEETLLSTQRFEKVTPEFIQECNNQVIIDFYGYNPMAVKPEEPAEQPEETTEEDVDKIEE